MRYREQSPPPDLAAAVECVWTLEAEAAPGRVEPVLPDGTTELVWHLGDPFEALAGPAAGSGEAAGPGEAAERRPRDLCVGPGDAPVRLRATGRVRLLGVRLRPGGAARFVRRPISELGNLAVDAADVLGPAARDVAEAAAGDGDFAAGADRAIRLLRAAASRRGDLSQAALRATAAARILSATGGRAPLDALCARFGVGPRQLQRDFRDAVGYGPKRLARILRFQAALRRLQRGGAAAPAKGANGADRAEATIAAVAAACGYADQAHLHRDFREFAGAPPAAFLRAAHALSDAFTAKES